MGKYFMYEKSDGTIEAIQPKSNRAIFQSNGVRHSVTSVSLEAHQLEEQFKFL